MSGPARPEPARLDPEIAELVIAMMPQARSEAWKIYQAAPHALNLDELTSLAYTGLVMAGARWPVYCEANGYDPAAVNYFAAYSLRRIRGAMLDAMRSADWVTRSTRSRAKALREAGQDTGKTEEELSASTGLTPKQIRDTAAGVAGRPVSFDAETHDVPDSGDVEEQVATSAILSAALAAMNRLDAQTQVVLALRYHLGRDFGDIAAALGITEQKVTELHNEGVLAVHNVMLKAVTLGSAHDLALHMIWPELTEADLRAARAFRQAQRKLLQDMNAADLTVSVFVRQVRHACAKLDGRSVNLELREHYVLSPDSYVPAGRFGFIFTQGRCPACGMTARSGDSRLVDPRIRPPAAHAVVTGQSAACAVLPILAA